MNESINYIKKGIPLSNEIQNRLNEITTEKKLVKGIIILKKFRFDIDVVTPTGEPVMVEM